VKNPQRCTNRRLLQRAVGDRGTSVYLQATNTHHLVTRRHNRLLSQPCVAVRRRRARKVRLSSPSVVFRVRCRRSPSSSSSSSFVRVEQQPCAFNTQRVDKTSHMAYLNKDIPEDVTHIRRQAHTRPHTQHATLTLSVVTAAVPCASRPLPHFAFSLRFPTSML
jgi:hypothetical protein